MKQFLAVICVLVAIAATGFWFSLASAAGPAFLYVQGGTGSSTIPALGQIFYAGATGWQSRATTTVSCSGTASCPSFVALGDSPVTITGSGGSSFPTSTNPLMATYFVGTSTNTASVFPFSSTTVGTITTLFSTNATTSTFAITGVLAANCNTTNALTTNSSGTVTCTAQPQGTVTAVSVATANGFAGSSGGGATPALTLTTTITGLLKGNGTAISAAALSDFPSQAANTFIANGTGASGAPTALASTSIFTASTGQVIYAASTGGLVGTSTIFIATNAFVGIASTTPFSRLSVGTGLASSSITIAEYAYGRNSNIATSTAANIDCNASTQLAWPIGTSATTLTLINLTPGKKCIVVVQNPNGGTAGTITWAVQSGFILKWAGGTAPTQTTTANASDVWSFLTTQGSSTNAVFGAASLNF